MSIQYLHNTVYQVCDHRQDVNIWKTQYHWKRINGIPGSRRREVESTMREPSVDPQYAVKHECNNAILPRTWCAGRERAARAGYIWGVSLIKRAALSATRCIGEKMGEERGWPVFNGWQTTGGRPRKQQRACRPRENPAETRAEGRKTRNDATWASQKP